MLLPLCLIGVASGIADDEPRTSLRLGPAGPRCCICSATAQTFVFMLSVLLWPRESLNNLTIVAHLDH